MLITRARIGYLAAMVSGVGIGVAVIGTAAAAPAAPAAKTVTHHYSLAPSAFAPDGIDVATQNYFNQWDPATLSNQDGGRCFNTGLSVPDGATLKSVTAYYTEGSVAMSFQIFRQNLPKHTADRLVQITTATSTTPVYHSTTKGIPKADAGVNMSKYAYSAGVCPSGNTTFSGLTITYTVPKP